MPVEKMVKYVAKLKPKEYLRRYLKVTPLALAVFRSIEAKNIATVSMEQPILDLGCGFGEFAGVFFESRIEMGLDVSWEELVAAKKADKYKKLTWADARQLPFGNDYFATVLSVSTLEHIEEAEKVVAEVFRVLKPGGKFVFTVNAKKINQFLFWPKVLKKWGFVGLAKKYPKFYHRIFKHTTLWDKEEWQKVLQKTGFKVEHVKEIISPEATKLFDFFLITAWPSQAIKLLTGRRWAWRPKWFRDWLIKKYGFLVEQEENEGSNLFVVAVKPPSV